MPMVAGEHALDMDGVVAVAAEERMASRQKTMVAMARVFRRKTKLLALPPSWLACMMAAGGSRLAS
ncbi:unnamed protein product [Triticum turgidum subsp. durum]|uniref:Uncharacterized protein n=1 Tax=Triticum turgidum subsp. durum TaxID=4567 RepID=A0A9R1C447_TRITD|nr:unnamed protein product [Triticum turgidum subsp. durum]